MKYAAVLGFALLGVASSAVAAGVCAADGDTTHVVLKSVQVYQLHSSASNTDKVLVSSTIVDSAQAVPVLNNSIRYEILEGLSYHCGWLAGSWNIAVHSKDASSWTDSLVTGFASAYDSSDYKITGLDDIAGFVRFETDTSLSLSTNQLILLPDTTHAFVRWASHGYWVDTIVGSGGGKTIRSYYTPSSLYQAFDSLTALSYVSQSLPPDTGDAHTYYQLLALQYGVADSAHEPVAVLPSATTASQAAYPVTGRSDGHVWYVPVEGLRFRDVSGRLRLVR